MAQEYVRNLIKKTMSGDKEARQELLKGYANDIVYRSRLYLGDEASAKAATTDIFMKMLNTLDKALEVDAFDEWYQKIVRDVAIRKVIPLTSDGVIKNIPYTRSDEVADYSEEYTMEDSRRMILNVITKLPKAERVVTTLYFFDGLTVKDIAQKLYLTEGEVESLITKAKTKINASGVSLGAFLQMLNNIKQTSIKTETLPISIIRNEPQEVSEEVVEEEVEEEIATEEEDYDQEVYEEDEDDLVIEGDDEMLIDSEEEVSLDTEEDSEPLFFTKHNHVIEEPMMQTEEMPQLDDEEEDIVESTPLERSSVKEEVVAEEVKEEPQAVVAPPVRKAPAKKKKASKKRRVDWLHLLILIGLALLLVLGLWYLLNRGKSKEPEVINVTPEPTAAVEPETNTENNETNAETNPEPVTVEAETGTLVVNGGMVINVRQSPSTEAEIVSSVYEGEEYHVYEVDHGDEYTWYRIGDDQWIADGGGWVTFTKD